MCLTSRSNLSMGARLSRQTLASALRLRGGYLKATGLLASHTLPAEAPSSNFLRFSVCFGEWDGDGAGAGEYYNRYSRGGQKVSKSIL